MNLSNTAAGLALVAASNAFCGATLTIYAGAKPATANDSLGTATALATCTFVSTQAFPGVPTANGTTVSLSGTFAVGEPTAVATGMASFARATMQPAAWGASKNYSRGNAVTNSGNLYVCVAGGTSASATGPAAQSYAIADGSVLWDYAGAATATVLGDFTVGTTTASDIVLDSVAITSGGTVSINNLNLQCNVG